MSERWWRAKNSAVNNRKLQKLPGDLFKAWFNVNCLASANGGVVPAIEDVAFALRLSEQRAAVVLTQLATAKLLDKQQDGSFIPHDWDEHQFKSDKKDPTAAERMQRHRDKKRNERNVTAVTDRNERNDTVSVKRPEAETEAETETQQSARELDEVGLKEETALRVLFTATRTALKMSVPNMDNLKLWLLDGIGKGTISAAVTPILSKKADMASLAYCDAAVRERHAKAQAAPSLEPVPLTEADWRSTVDRYKANRSLWSRHAGPEPGMAGCRCPVQVLVDAAIDPTSGDDMGAGWYFIAASGPEMPAWIHDAQVRKAKPPRVYELDDGCRVGFFSRKLVPDGYDEATGERLPPKAEDAA